MRIHLLAIGTRVPSWVEEGFGEYAKRIRGDCSLHLKPLPAAKRPQKGVTEADRQEEGIRLLKAVPKNALIVALDEGGKSLKTRDLAAKITEWKQNGQDLALLVGGPDGLSKDCLEQAVLAWSLSPLTLPHGLVRVLVAEALYRAWSLGHNHPYHRD